MRNPLAGGCAPRLGRVSMSAGRTGKDGGDILSPVQKTSARPAESAPTGGRRNDIRFRPRSGAGDKTPRRITGMNESTRQEQGSERPDIDVVAGGTAPPLRGASHVSGLYRRSRFFEVGRQSPKGPVRSRENSSLQMWHRQHFLGRPRSTGHLGHWGHLGQRRCLPPLWPWQEINGMGGCNPCRCADSPPATPCGGAT